MKEFCLPEELLDRANAVPVYANDPLKLIRQANDEFSLGIERQFFEDVERALDVALFLYKPELLTLNDLDIFAAAKKLPDDFWSSLIREDRVDFIDDRARDFRAFGFPDISELFEEYHSIIDDFVFETTYHDGEPFEFRVSNEDALNAKRDEMTHRMEQAIKGYGIKTPSECFNRLPGMEHVTLKPREEFNQFWVETIRGSRKFRTYQADVAKGDIHLSVGPFTWMTSPHGAALRALGYKYEFDFWADPGYERKIGETRGDLWIQTDRGVLRLTDATDSTSVQAVFPVQVSDAQGEPLFELIGNDVSKRMLRAQPSDDAYYDFDRDLQELERGPISRLLRFVSSPFQGT